MDVRDPPRRRQAQRVQNEHSDAGRGLGDHDEELRRVAERANVDEGLVWLHSPGWFSAGCRTRRSMTDSRATVPSPDGQFSPLRGLPQLLAKVRRTVTPTT
jgi:hypothetical protein